MTCGAPSTRTALSWISWCNGGETRRRRSAASTSGSRGGPLCRGCSSRISGAAMGRPHASSCPVWSIASTATSTTVGRTRISRSARENGAWGDSDLQAMLNAFSPPMAPSPRTSDRGVTASLPSSTTSRWRHDSRPGKSSRAGLGPHQERAQRHLSTAVPSDRPRTS